MNTFRRMSTSFVAHIDRVLGQIENHDALIESTLREMRRGAARAKTSLARVRRDGETLRRRHAEAESQEQTWRRRAVACRDKDEEKALECLRRAKRARADAEALETRLREHDVRERELTEEVRRLEHRVTELQERHHRMRTRAACVEGVAQAEGVTGGPAQEIEAAFERWEERVAETELGTVPIGDPFAQEFDSAEELHDLRAELAELHEADDFAADARAPGQPVEK